MLHATSPLRRNARSLLSVISITCLTAITACGGHGSPPKKNEQTEVPDLVTLDEDTCLGIFDEKTVAEARRDHDLSQVVAPRDGEDFSIKISLWMSKEMATSKPEAGSPCAVLEKSGRNKLFIIKVNWGPETFPPTERKNGKTASYSVRKTGTGKRAELLVDCQRPDLVQKSKSKRMLPFQVTLFDNVGLSDRADFSILTKSAQRFTDLKGRLSCQNKITYPAPETVTVPAR